MISQTNSTIRKVLDSIVDTLTEHAYFQTQPVIPVLVEDMKDIEGEVLRATQTSGAFVVVSFGSGDVGSMDIPGPYLDECEINISACEIPSIWRAKNGPTTTEIAEAIMRILHHTQPFDDDDEPIVPSPLLIKGLKTDPNESMMIVRVTAGIAIPLSNVTPTR